MTDAPAMADVLARGYRYEVVPDDGSFFIRFPDLPGCMTQVESQDEIGAAAQEILELWVETAFELGREVPLPASSEYSGKLTLRLPRDLHRKVAERAREDQVSINQYITWKLAVGSTQDLADTSAHRLCNQLTKLVEVMTKNRQDSSRLVRDQMAQQAISAASGTFSWYEGGRVEQQSIYDAIVADVPATLSLLPPQKAKKLLRDPYNEATARSAKMAWQGLDESVSVVAVAADPLVARTKR